MNETERALVAAPLRAAAMTAKLARLGASCQLKGEPLPDDFRAMVAMTKTYIRSMGLQVELEQARRRRGIRHGW